jgi:hypothetical protein
VFPEQRGYAAFVGRSRKDVADVGVVEQVLNHEGVDIDQGGLHDPQALHTQLLFVGPIGGHLTDLAVVDDAVGAVPRLDDIEPFLDLALQLPAAQIPAQKDCLLGTAQLDHRLIGRVSGVGLHEPPQNCLRRCGTGADRGGVLHHLVVLLGDQLPPDRARHRRPQLRPQIRLPGGWPVQLALVDPFDPW